MSEGATHLRARGAVASLFLLAVLWTACNTDQTGPEVDLPAGLDLRPQFYTSGGVEGSLQLGIPSNNNPPAYGSVPRTLVVTASKYDFVQIVVSGNVSSSFTGLCDPQWGSTGTFGPWGNASNGELRVKLTHSVSGGIPTTGYPNTITANRGITEAVDTFWVERAGPGGSPCNPWPTPMISLGSGQTVDYEVYPFFEVSASAAVVTSGDTVTFTATSHWSPTNPLWRYRAGDTTSTPAGPGGAWVCSGASTCDYAVTQSGRMYRYGTFPAPNASQYAMPGPIVWVGSAPPFTLEITAPATAPTRGETAEFSVRNTGVGGELNGVELTWSFHPDSIELYPGKPKYDLAPVVEGPSGADTAWAGQIVASGTVRVIGTRESEADTAEYVVNPQPRSWGTSSVIWTGFLGDLPIDTVFGRNVNLQGSGSMLDLLYGGHAIASVNDSGPNHGYWYVGSVDYYSLRAYVTTPWVRSDGPDSIPHGGSKISNYDLLALNGYDSLAAWGGIVDHEGYGIGATRRGHQAMFEDYVGNVATCANIRHPLERVAGDSAEVAFEIAGIENKSFSAMSRAMSHENVYGNHSNSPFYDWLPTWDLKYHTDIQHNDAPTNPDPQRCNWSGI